MANNRVFYASHGVALAAETGTPSTTGVANYATLQTVAGAQSVTMNTNFNLEQVFQLGRLELYDNVVTDPGIEVTVSKVLDGKKTIYELAVGSGSIVNNANKRTKLALGVGPDTQENLANSGSTVILCDPVYLSSVNYTLSVDGNFTEECNFVGNDKRVGVNVSGVTVAAPTGSVGSVVLRRQNLSSSSRIPVEVSGQNIQSITISADFGREQMFKLGRLSTFHRYVTFPLEVSCEIEVLATGLDTLEVAIPDAACSGLSLAESEGYFVLCDTSGNDTYFIDLGNKLKLTSVAFGGGDTGGGNATLTYSYVTYNDLSVSSSGAL